MTLCTPAAESCIPLSYLCECAGEGEACAHTFSKVALAVKFDCILSALTFCIHTFWETGPGWAHLESVYWVFTFLPSCLLVKGCLAPGPQLDKSLWTLGICQQPKMLTPPVQPPSVLSPPHSFPFSLCHSYCFGMFSPTEAGEPQGQRCVEYILFAVAAPAQSLTHSVIYMVFAERVNKWMNGWMNHCRLDALPTRLWTAQQRQFPCLFPISNAPTHSGSSRRKLHASWVCFLSVYPQTLLSLAHPCAWVLTTSTWNPQNQTKHIHAFGHPNALTVQQPYFSKPAV